MKALNKIFYLLGYEINIVNLKKAKKRLNIDLVTAEEKQAVIQNLVKESGCDIFIESGTYLGDTTFTLKDIFKEMYSIELAKDLYKNAIQKFQPYKHIHIIFGDSGVELPKLIPNIKGNAIFWLDGHFSGGITAKGDLDAPLENELDAIQKSVNKGFSHIILIDDARLILNETKYTGYPRFEELKEWVSRNLPEYKLSEEKDILIIKK